MRVVNKLMVLIVSAFCLSCHASEESPLVLSSFLIESRLDDGQSVVVSGKGGKGSIAKLTVHAFGRDHELGPGDIKKMSGIRVNGVQISVDGGFLNSGGKAVIIVLTTGYSYGVVEKRYVVVNEAGGLEVMNSIE